MQVPQSSISAFPAAVSSSLGGQPQKVAVNALLFSGTDEKQVGRVIGTLAVIGYLLKPVILPYNNISGRITVSKLDSAWKKVSAQSDEAKAEFLFNAALQGRLHRDFGAVWAAGKVKDIENDDIKTKLIISLINRFHISPEIIGALAPAVQSVQAEYGAALTEAYNMAKNRTPGGFEALRSLSRKLSN